MSKLQNLTLWKERGESSLSRPTMYEVGLEWATRDSSFALISIERHLSHPDSVDIEHFF